MERAKHIVLAFPDEGVSVTAILLGDLAPRTCDAVWQHLPLSGFAHHGIYSGSEVYVHWPSPFEVEPENQTSAVLPGDVGYYYQPGGRHYGFPDDFCEVCWFYDRAAVPSMPGGPVRVNLFASMIGNPESFFAVCHRMRIEGRKPFLVSAAEE